MQTYFHHAVTYVAARLAGMFHADADTMDDAVSDGAIRFSNCQQYSRVTSAHKMLDPANVNAIDNRMVWVPFHSFAWKCGSTAVGRFIQADPTQANAELPAMDAAFCNSATQSRQNQLQFRRPIVANHNMKNKNQSTRHVFVRKRAVWACAFLTTFALQSANAQYMWDNAAYDPTRIYPTVRATCASFAANITSQQGGATCTTTLTSAPTITPATYPDGSPYSACTYKEECVSSSGRYAHSIASEDIVKGTDCCRRPKTDHLTT